VHVTEQLSRLARVRRHLAAELDREPELEELAAALGLAPEQVSELMLLARETLSLDSPVGDEGDAVVADVVQDSNSLEAEQVVAFRELRDQLEVLLRRLPEREATVLRLRFGLADGTEHSLAQIGERLGLTRERIRQIEKSTIGALREFPEAGRLLELVA
jgi:DNA-directed RNA polymerase sigma subunit (sigma70/sigma32)